MPEDRSDPASSGARKAKPPVIELTATDVTPESPPNNQDSDQQKEQTQSEPPRAQAAASPEHKVSEAKPLLFPVLAGVVGLLAGALLLSLAVLFAGDGAKRLLVSAAETASGSKAASDLTALGARADQLAQRQDDIAKQIAALAAQIEAQAKEIKSLDIAALRTRLEAAETALKAAGTVAEQNKSAETQAREELAAKFAALEAQVKQAQARPAVANAAEVVALGALRDAIARGAPFTRELNAVRAMLGEAGAALAPFEKAAASGLPTIADLRKRFTALAPKLAHEPKNEGGYFSRLMSNAGRLVEVRPIGEAAGDSAGAVVARVETRLGNNDLAGALEEAAKMPAAAKAQAADWFADASRRREADVAVNNLLNAALTQPKAGQNSAGQAQ